MSATRVLFTSVACMMFIAMLLGDFQSAEARYLPTRSNSDRLDKLRELLKEVSKMHKLLQSEIEKEEYQENGPPRWHPETKLFYKREAEQPSPLK